MSLNKIIFIHIPKAGGSTLQSIIASNYPSEKIFHLAGSREAMIEFGNRVNALVQKYDCIMGHMGFGFHKKFEDKYYYLTMLRHPVELVVSLYYFILRTPQHFLYERIVSSKLTLEEFVNSDLTHFIRDGQTRMLASTNGVGLGFDVKQKLDTADLETAKSHMREHFAAVGTLEQFDLYLRLLQKLFGWKNISYERQNVTVGRPPLKQVCDSVKDAIMHHNPIDLELHQYATSLLIEQCKDEGIVT